MVTKSVLLQELPPFTNSSLLIESNQDVPDIMREVVNAHKIFSSDYDSIYKYFVRSSVEATCKALFDFCKENIRYVIESDQNQTTRSPSAILSIGSGDCKHYAAFIAGVLSAITRHTREKINWAYRFASYSLFDKTPGHVFVVVFDNGNELWIDPVLKTFNERYIPTYTVDKKVSDMPLYRLAGPGDDYDQTALLNEALDITPDLYYSIDDEDANLSPELLAAIHLLVENDILDVDGNANDVLLQSLQDYMPAAEYEQLVAARQLLYTASIGGFFSTIWRGVKKATLAIPRTAYLSIVALNVFGTASRLKEATRTQSDIDKVRGKWYSLGGDWQALENAIRNGSKKARILGIGNPAPAAWAVTAAAIIAAMTPIITSILKQRQQAGMLDPSFNPDYINDTSNLPGQNNIMDFLKQNVVWIAAGGVLIWYYIKNRKR